jgi:hypothetical protein
MTFRAALYKGTHAGLPGVYNRLVRWWTRSQYSHVELVFSSGRAASASYIDGGVRFKLIEFDPAKWDFVDLPDELEFPAYDWFTRHRGEKYDLVGNLHFVLSAVGHDRKRWFCSEAVGAALGIPEPHRYDPGTLASALTIYNRPAPAGFFTPTERHP